LIVVDTNILAYLFIQGPRTGDASRLLGADPVWAVPELWRHEFLNVLATVGKGGGGSLDSLSTIWAVASKDLEGKTRPVNPFRALELALDLRVSGYDAQYLALAESLGVHCVTEDARLVKASQGLAMSISDFLAARA
jgi:predicted nucleic acid-binding protein